MKKLVVLFALLSILSPMAAQFSKKIEGSKVFTTTVKAIGVAKQITLSIDAVVTLAVKPDSVGYVQIYCEDNLPPYIDFEMKKGRMNIRELSSLKLDHSGIYMTLYINEPTDLTIAGNGIFKMFDPLHVTTLNLFVEGAGQMLLHSLQVDGELRASANGNGDMMLKGKAGSAVFKQLGSAEIRAKELIVDDVNASIMGTGNISCHAVKTLKATLTWSGNVNYLGSPEIKSTTIGKGQIIPIKE